MHKKSYKWKNNFNVYHGKVTVELPVTRRPPRRSRRSELSHRALSQIENIFIAERGGNHSFSFFSVAFNFFCFFAGGR